MYVVLIDYTAPLEEIDFALPDHVDWLARQHGAGYFLASGRRGHGLGEVIIARPMVRAKLQVLVATDPFVLRHLVRAQIIEFSATRTAHELANCNEALSPG